MCDRSELLPGRGTHEGEGVCYVALQDMDALPEKVKDYCKMIPGGMRLCGVAERLWSRSIPGAQRAKTLAAWIAEDAAQ